MIRQKTVFVVGAGASSEVGLPLGSELQGRIVNVLNAVMAGSSASSPEFPLADAIINSATPDVSLEVLLLSCKSIASALRLAPSIDDYINAHRSDRSVSIVGKLAIAHVILQAERNSAMTLGRLPLTPDSFDGLLKTWYIPLWRALVQGGDARHPEVIFENVQFIIFNYDRCVELFMYFALKAYLRCEDALAASVTNSLNIIHPYGSIGPLPWQREKTDDPASVEFGQDVADIKMMAKCIRTFSEQTTDETDIEKARKWLREAQTIVFLGFAYHDLNMELLRTEGRKESYQILGTALGSSNADRQVIRTRIDQALPYSGGSIELLDQGTCVDLIGQHSMLLQVRR